MHKMHSQTIIIKNAQLITLGLGGRVVVVEGALDRR